MPSPHHTRRHTERQLPLLQKSRPRLSRQQGAASSFFIRGHAKRQSWHGYDTVDDDEKCRWRCIYMPVTVLAGVFRGPVKSLSWSHYEPFVVSKTSSRDRMVAVKSSYGCFQNTKTTAKMRDEYAPGGGGKGLVYGKQRQLPAVRETRGCVSVTTGSCTGYDDMLKRSLPGVCQISGIPASRHSCLMLSGQMLACISPLCALWSITMQRRLCPIPPPMERGSLPSSSWRWK